MSKILIIDDEESVRYSFQRLFKNTDILVETAPNGAEGIEKFQQGIFDLVLLDIRLPDISGLDVLQKLKHAKPKAVVIMMTAFGTTQTAIEATKYGAFEYILKPFDPNSIIDIINSGLDCSHLMNDQVVFESDENQISEGDKIIGASAVMQAVYKMVGRIAGANINVLLRGESGTGKELIARAIYQHSHRSEKPFYAVNCAAIPETLIESELFGHEKGAFTGASQRRIGKFEQANNGTLFLDEVGDMSFATQAKILRVLQEGCFERVGGEQSIVVDVRLIVATNRNLENMIEEGKFREDLYYRIKGVTISLPPLHLRKQDILELALYFLDKYCARQNKDKMILSKEAIEKMLEYRWPGNVRELENVIRRAVVLSQSFEIPAHVIEEEFSVSVINETNPNRIDNQIRLDEDYLNQFSGNLYDETISRVEKLLLVHVLSKTGGNQVKAAEQLGISRVMLRGRIHKFGISNEVYLKTE